MLTLSISSCQYRWKYGVGPCTILSSNPMVSLLGPKLLLMCPMWNDLSPHDFDQMCLSAAALIHRVCALRKVTRILDMCLDSQRYHFTQDFVECSEHIKLTLKFMRAVLSYLCFVLIKYMTDLLSRLISLALGKLRYCINVGGETMGHTGTYM